MEYFLAIKKNDVARRQKDILLFYLLWVDTIFQISPLLK